MDFELNQNHCTPLDTTDGTDNCAGNSVTPLRVAGDELVTYDLSQGGTHPTISLRTWDGSVWGPASVLSSSTTPAATGSVNTSSIASADSGGLCSLTGFPACPSTGLSPYTFGEASVNLGLIFNPNSCHSF